MYEHDRVISEYEHERFRPREAEALQALRKVASLVKPIMRQRGWTVGVLTEFWPPEKNLLGLNWNKGQKICLRLRYPYDERQFLPLEEVVDTMLHELCHIVYGPHDEAFHSLWDQLRTEHEQLICKGYTGEGFLSTGHKLGGARVPLNEARRRARAAAEKRQNLTAGSGQKLGGAGVKRGQDIRKVIADAASRRMTVTKGCASGTEKGKEIVEETTRNGFRTKAEEDDANDEAIMQAYIELIQECERENYGNDYILPRSTNPAGGPEKASTSTKPPPIPTISKSRKPYGSFSHDSRAVSPPHAPPTIALPPEAWTCGICTLSNPPSYLCCDACGTERASLSTFPAYSQTRNPALAQEHPRQSLHNHSKPSLSSPSKDNRAIRSLSALSASANKKPLGWLCHKCGTFMENEWWACASCGTIKLTS